ncbi:MAG: hypothetical protein L0211_08250 [Planctomycetaceae bacterium]|nr:hypothetical protein [Planctomycetaceae bacterium]
MIVMAAAPPLLAGGYFLAKEAGPEALVVFGVILWLLLIVDLLWNPAISTNGKIVWLLMMTLSCPVATLLYAAVRLHGWVVDVDPRQTSAPDSRAAKTSRGSGCPDAM